MLKIQKNKPLKKVPTKLLINLRSSNRFILNSFFTNILLIPEFSMDL